MKQVRKLYALIYKICQTNYIRIWWLKVEGLIFLYTPISTKMILPCLLFNMRSIVLVN